MNSLSNQIYDQFYMMRISFGVQVSNEVCNKLSDKVCSKVSDNYVPFKQEIYKQMSPILFREVWNKLEKNK